MLSFHPQKCPSLNNKLFGILSNNKHTMGGGGMAQWSMCSWRLRKAMQHATWRQKNEPQTASMLAIHLSLPWPPFLGLFFFLPCLDTYHKVDLRLQTLEIPFHEVSQVVDFAFFLHFPWPSYHFWPRGEWLFLLKSRKEKEIWATSKFKTPLQQRTQSTEWKGNLQNGKKTANTKSDKRLISRIYKIL